MRRQKPIPKESSFGEFAANRAKSTRFKKDKKDKKPGVSAKIRNMFNDKDDKKSEGRSRSSGSRTTKTEGRGRSSDSRGSRSESRGRTSYSRDSRSEGRGRSSDSGSRRTFNDKPDRRVSRGNSFKEDRRVSAKRELFDAVCANCNKPCKVPFRPTTGKPISCSECFEAGGHRSEGRAPQKSWDSIHPSLRGKERRARSAGRQSFGDEPSSQRFANTNSGVKELFDAVCMKCGNKCKVPFKPTGKMGVSCSNCFDKNKAPGKPRRKSGDKRTGSRKTGDKKTYAQKINDGNKKAFSGRGQKPSRATRTFNGR